LRVIVNNGELVDRQMLKRTGATGILGKNRDVQIFYNKGVEQIRTELTSYVKRARESEGLEEEDIRIGNERIIEKIYTPVEGDIIYLADIYGYEALGDENRDGIAIFPKRGEIRSPFDGEVRAVQSTGNQLIITSKQGINLLIHLGRGLEQLRGEGFRIHVNEGDIVRKGRLLVEFDLEMMTSRGYDMTVFVIILKLGANQGYKAYIHENVNFEHIAMTIFDDSEDCS
ncbi:MAG: PTS glucose transporter subunit IIA, partial [Coprococcus sp.]